MTAEGSPGRPRALLLEDVHQDAVALLKTAGYDVSEVAGALDEQELAARLPGVTVLGVRSKTNVPASVLAAAPDLLAVGAFCIGTNQIDLAAAATAGIAVFNAPFSNTRSVVELAVAEIIALTRRLTGKDALTARRASGTSPRPAATRCAAAGSASSATAISAANCRCSPRRWAWRSSSTTPPTSSRSATPGAAEPSTSCSRPSTSSRSTSTAGRATTTSSARDQFARMRPGSLFLNLSRGFVVDHGALRECIESGQLAGAAVDVFPTEPKARGEEFYSELRGLPNVILTPHIGGSTEEAQQDIGHFVAGKLRDYVVDGTTTLSVNLPPVALPREGGIRLLHFHRNTPGVLATVDGVLADHGINIEGQLLATRGEYGYVITDIGVRGAADGAVAAAMEQLCALPGSVRLRAV